MQCTCLDCGYGYEWVGGTGKGRRPLRCMPCRDKRDTPHRTKLRQQKMLNTDPRGPKTFKERVPLKVPKDLGAGIKGQGKGNVNPMTGEQRDTKASGKAARARSREIADEFVKMMAKWPGGW